MNLHSYGSEHTRNVCSIVLFCKWNLWDCSGYSIYCCKLYLESCELKICSFFPDIGICTICILADIIRLIPKLPRDSKLSRYHIIYRYAIHCWFLSAIGFVPFRCKICILNTVKPIKIVAPLFWHLGLLNYFGAIYFSIFSCWSNTKLLILIFVTCDTQEIQVLQ